MNDNNKGNNNNNLYTNIHLARERERERDRGKQMFSLDEQVTSAGSGISLPPGAVLLFLMRPIIANGYLSP